MLQQKKFSRIVVKIGSSLLSAKGAAITLKYLEPVMRQINGLLLKGTDVVLVSSGAIACGMHLLRLSRRPKDISGLQAAAAIGQNELMGIYRRLLKSRKRLCAQILLSWDDFDDRERYVNIRHTIGNLLKNKVLPIVNENDTVSTEEIRFGDNDRLSSLVANLMGADLLIILSDVDGLYKWPKKEVISVVNEITPQIKALCCSTDKEFCVGGMSSKIEAIKSATALGIPCVIVNGKSKDVILNIAAGKPQGTFFLAKQLSIGAKKRWLAYGGRVKGVLVVDDGAKKALVTEGRSLLSVGITGIKGVFRKNDVVSIVDANLCEFARGKVNLSSEDIDSHKGERIKEEVINRDNLVIL